MRVLDEDDSGTKIQGSVDKLTQIGTVEGNVVINAESNPSSKTRSLASSVGSLVFTVVALACGSTLLLNLVMGAFHIEIPKVNVSTPPTKYTLVYLGIGLGGVLLNSFWVNRAARQGEQRLQQALDELKRQIGHRLAEPRLLTANAIRGLALGIERSWKCAVITDKLIIETIRALALDIEGYFHGDALVRRLELLNRLLKDIDAEAPPLLSLALVDRLTAYRKSLPYAAIFLFVAALSTSMARPLQRYSFLPALFLGLEFMLLFSTIRALLFWKRAATHPDTKSRLTAWLYPAKPHPILDFFLIASMSRGEGVRTFWHLSWAPLWEQPIFMRYILNPSKIAIMHQFRYDIARALYRQLRQVQRQIDLDRAKGVPPSQSQTGQFVALCQRLWIVTGDQRFREIERRGELTVNDSLESVIRYL